MAETNVQALEKIFTEVDESQIKIIFSSQCIKGKIYFIHSHSKIIFTIYIIWLCRNWLKEKDVKLSW